jgi:3-dehydroquinate synthetase
LRLSGRPTDVVEETLAPQPVRVDRERAWDAMRRDKKARGGALRLVLLGHAGAIVDTRPDAEVRSALDELIAE